MTVLLILIYIMFISLGLPDSLLGTSWPVMYKSLNVDVSMASVVSTITLFATAAISFDSGRYIRKFGTYKVSFVSVIFTIAGMIGIAVSPNIYLVILASIILGMGGGAIDAALNAYVSKYFSAKHMNWLHAFWGVGVTVSPLVMSVFLANDNWRLGYISIACLQSIILLIVYIKRDKWNIIKENFEATKHREHKSRIDIITQKGVITSIIGAGLYSAIEFSLGTWMASYLVFEVHISPSTAASWVSLYYMGIMIGRILAGFISVHIKDKHLVFGGAILALVGMMLILLPWHASIVIGLFIIGLGYGPIYPAQLHGIPTYFGPEYAGDIIGFHMGGAYTLGFLAQLLVGFVASRVSFKVLPIFLIVTCVVMILCTQLLFMKLKSKGKKI